MKRLRRVIKQPLDNRGTEPNSVLGQIQHITENVVCNNTFNQIQEEEKAT